MAVACLSGRTHNALVCTRVPLKSAYRPYRDSRCVRFMDLSHCATVAIAAAPTTTTATTTTTTRLWLIDDRRAVAFVYSTH